MAFRDFQFPQVLDQLGLRLEDDNLFAGIPHLQVRAEFAAFIRDGAEVAAANSTEKAKSEFVIAPILIELRRMLGYHFAVFSGLEWTVDEDRGLNGFCDWILTRGKTQHMLRAPFVAIVEAKNDTTRTGLGQCIASVYAAQLCNERDGMPQPKLHGVVSTGSAWKFLRLTDATVILDAPEYYIDDLPRIMGILKAIVEGVD